MSSACCGSEIASNPWHGLPSGLSRRCHNWSATAGRLAFSGFRRVCPGGATTGPLPRGDWPFQASVEFIPAVPQLVRCRGAIGLFRLPSSLSRRCHNWSATAGRSAFSGFRRVYPGGATTGRLPRGDRPFQASVGFIPAVPQLVRCGGAIGLFRLPSGLSRRCHNWSATAGRSASFQASVGFIPAVPQLVGYRGAIGPFRLPSGLSRRGHNWSATVTP